MSDYPPPPPPQGPPPAEPGPEAPTSRYQPYPGGGPYPGAQSPGSQYAAPQYPGAVPPPGGPPGGWPPGSAPASGSGDEFQQRLTRRPEPRFTTALAGVGAAMALLGVLIWGGTYFGEGLFASGPNTDRNLLGAGLAAALVVVGFILAVTRRRGPLATAGVVAVGVGVPLTLLFLTIDVQSSSGINYDAVFWVSFIVWGLCYAVVPGMRGHTFFVFLMATQLLSYVVSKTTDNLTAGVATGSAPGLPSNGTFAAIGLGFGLGYYVIAFLLDRSGRHGPATALVYPAFFATAGGIAALSPDIHLAGTGVLAVVIGFAVCWYGGRYGRRLTCFAAAAGAALGIGLLIADAVDNDGTEAGITFLLVGLAVVAIAALLAHALGEPDDMTGERVAGSR
ncbi:MAG: hypothetical protein QOI15_1937 [Pseudonocardiales bacterium]|nr:hypothetical protein [Pseudonocardiales bacterium]